MAQVIWVGEGNGSLLVRDQGLILQRQTSTYYAKELAQHAAIEIPRLAILADNEFDVR